MPGSRTLHIRINDREEDRRTVAVSLPFSLCTTAKKFDTTARAARAATASRSDGERQLSSPFSLCSDETNFISSNIRLTQQCRRETEEEKAAAYYEQRKRERKRKREKGREKERLSSLLSPNPPPFSPSVPSPLLVDAVTLSCRRCLQLLSATAATALVRQSRCICSSTSSPSSAVGFFKKEMYTSHKSEEYSDRNNHNDLSFLFPSYI
ncbi:hypothetical protein Q3G72_034001 [Acer saccharum]|nr:hypothetical protein Q3G72_034001 [Acer saccharum]